MTKKGLKDVECLLLEVGVTAQKQELGNSKGRPWAGVAEDLLQVCGQLLVLCFRCLVVVNLIES